MSRMPSRLCDVVRSCLAALALAALTGAANAQPTAQQQSAIRSSCRSDFMSKCSGVTPGGKDALNCLQKNVASLAPACKTAVSATIPPPAPAQAAPAPAPAPAAQPPASAPRSTTTAPPPPAATARPAQKPAQVQKPAAPPPQQPVAAPAPTQPAARTPNAPVVMTAVIGRACMRDLIIHCRGVGVGDGQKIACLMARGPKLAPLCKAALKITEPVR